MAASEHQYFCEDEVYRVTKKGNVQFGMVVENSEFVSGDENSDEEEEEGGRMKRGHIRVAWHPTGVEEVIPEGKVQLADRALMPGDVVRRLIKGKDTQRGYCRDIRVAASVQVVGTKQVITNIGSANLIPLEEFGVDIVACLDSWVGSIKNVHSKLILLCNDGSRCMISDVDACGFESFSDKRDSDSQFTGHRDDFYTGQTLWGPVHVLEDADWIYCTKEMKANCSKPNKTIKVIVEDVKTDNVGINWQCRAYSKDGASADKEQPKFLVQGEDLKRLKLLNVFEPCTVQVGDRNFYTFCEGDNVITKEQWRKEQKDKVLNTALNARRNSWMKRNSKQIKLQNAAAAIAAAVAANNGTVVNGNGNGENVSALDSMPPPPPPPPADHDDWDTEDTTSVSDTASISSGASSIASQAKKKRGPALMTKVLKKKKLRRAKKRLPNVSLEPGARVVVETLSTSSIADVVWQDGTVEENILSTQLYPIHHLDDQEFFPGDFVIENKDDSCMQVYGVVQSVDHLGRTACVKWFKTYTSLEDPQPALLQETEVSVYDMKDHPDFQYRPGTVVIRVANFEGPDAQCTAGQVLDNYPKGMVRVWWVDGHISMSWPQDLYKVGEYDSDEGELWDDGSSDASWETESEDCCIAEDDIQIDEDEIMREKLNPRLGANIEKARIAMSRLEEIFMQNPTLQTTKVMRQLLEAYKDCRYLDKLMGTSFFHESHFQGLLERVRERGRANAAQRVADQVNRLFQNPDGTDVTEVDPMETNDDQYFLDNRSELEDIHFQDMDTSAGNSYPPLPLDQTVTPLSKRKLQTAANNNKNMEHSDHNKDERPCKEDKKSKDGCKASKTQQEPKVGKHARPTAPTEPPLPLETTIAAFSGANSHVCAKLCALIKTQLLKAHSEVTHRFCANPNMTLSGAVDSGSGSSQKSDGDMDAESLPPESSAPTAPTAPTEAATGGDSVLTMVKGGIESLLQRLSPLATAAAGSPAPDAEAAPTDTSKQTETTPLPSQPSEEAIVEEESPDRCLNPEGFSVADCAPSSHKFKLTMFQPTDPSGFFRAVRKELRLLKTSLPAGIWVKGFEDRMDLYSVMIRGPEKTPYEDGLFFFDFQLSADYPRAPPLCHYVSYCSDRLNPNLYEDGKVCVSLLGTWSGKGTEVWTPSSNLLQVIVSIQGLILVSEPYFNEAGYEKQKGSQSGSENSRMYNEMAVLKLVQALTKMATHPPPVFKDEIVRHFSANGHKFLNRLDSWLDVSEGYNNTHPGAPTTPGTFRDNASLTDIQLPEFPLIPASKGFCLTLRKTIVTLKEVLASVGIHEQPPAS